MKATTFFLVWYIIWDVGTVGISHPRLANYTFMRRSVGSIMYVWQASFRRRGGWDGCGCGYGAGRQYVILARSLVRSTGFRATV